MKLIKIFNVYVNPDNVNYVEAFESESETGFRISLTGGTVEGKFGNHDGKPRHTIEDLVDAIQNGKDLID